MNLRTSPDGTALLDGQCERLIKVGGAFELLKRL